MSVTGDILVEMHGVEADAWAALATHKFSAFGWHATNWERLKHSLPQEERKPTPFRTLVEAARAELVARDRRHRTLEHKG